MQIKQLFRTALALLTLGLASNAEAQVTVTATGGTLSATYPTINAAVTAINGGTHTGTITVDVQAGHTEVAPAGGIIFTATGTAGTPILIQKSGAGANPVITAYTGGTGTPATATQDGIFNFVGSDYVTIDGINLAEDPANTGNARMENGYAFYKTSATDGCQNNTIRNCVVTLSRENFATGSGPRFEGSIGILFTNATRTAAVTALTVTAATGSNSNNRLFSNTLQNCNYGIAFSGFAAASPFTFGDTDNEIGTASAFMGNYIYNFGGGAASTNPSAAIRTVNQWSLRVVNNTINNNTGSGVNHVNTLRGILIGNATSASTTITNNSVTLQGGATTSLVEGISSSAGSTAAGNTIIINSNSVSITYNSATSGAINAIINGGTPANLTMNNNSVTVPSYAGTGTFLGLDAGTPTNATMTQNSVTNVSRSSTGSGTTRPIRFGSPTNITITNNLVDNISYTNATSTGNIEGIYGLNSSANVTISNNIIRNLSTPTTGTLTGIREWGSSGVKVVSNNQIYNFSTTAGGAGGASMNGISLSIGTITVASNQIYALNSTGSTGGTGGTLNGILIGSSTADVTTISANKIYDISSASTNPVISGIAISTGTTHTLHNNLIGDLRAPAANAANAIFGISISSGTTANIYYNTVFLNASSSGANFGTSALSVATGTTVNVNNNIFVNNSTANGTGLAVAYRRSSTTLSSYGNGSNRNAFFASTIYTDGTNTDATLSAYQTRVAPRDANSINENPNFLSTVGSNANFLHINTTIPTAIESGGASISGITTDFDGDVRFGEAGYTGTGIGTDIGADEFELVLPNCTGVSPSTITTPSAVYCAGGNPTHNIATNTPLAIGAGISYQWQVSNTPGGPYTNVVGGSNPNATSYTSGILSTGTYYFVLRTSCSFSATSVISNEAAVTVNPSPTVTVSPATVNYCGTTPVTLTASGAAAYAWGPAAGLSGTTGAAVSASPASTTVYSVTGTTNGCSTIASATVGVVSGITITSISATPAAITTGGNTQLDVVAAQSYDARAGAYAFSATTGTYSAITGTVVSLTDFDDQVVTGLPIGFTFNYNGAQHTDFAANANGMIALSSISATLPFTNNLATSGYRNVLAPLWDDNNMTGGSIIYATTGTAPNRILTVQWTGMHVGGVGSTTNPTIDVQVRIYEANGLIEFVYGGTSAALASTTASIGISGATNNFRSVTPLLPVNASTSSSTTENTGINSATNFPSGTIYRFTPLTAPVLSYAWTPASFLNSTTIANPLASNVTTTTPYSVQVTSSYGCTAMATVTVSVSAVLAATLNASSDVTCNGAVNGSASASASGGFPPYLYAWSSGQSTANITGLQGGVYVLTVTDATLATTQLAVTISEPSAITATASATNVSCNGGSNGTATVAVSGGTSPYNYLWTGGATTASINARPAGSYDVTVTDNAGCTALRTVTITEPAAFTASAAQATAVSCNGGSNGSATASGTGATDFLWNNGQTTATAVGLSAGSYTVTVTNGDGCQATAAVTLTEPAQLFANISGVNNPTGCTTNNGSATALSSGGTGLVSFLWNNSQNTPTAINLGAGTFTVTATDANGCQATAQVTLNASAGITLTAPAATALCNGAADATVSVTVAGGTAPYTFVWNNGATSQSVANLAAGSYGVTVSDNSGCVNNATVIVSEPAALLATTTATDASCQTCTDGSAVASTTGGTGVATFEWTDGQTTATATGLATGSYTVTVTDANGCQTTATAAVGFAIGVVENNAQTPIRLFPNPTTSIVTLENLPAQARITLLNALGQEIRSIETQNAIEQLDLSDLPAATYYLRIQSAGAQTTLPVVRIR